MSSYQHRAWWTSFSLSFLFLVGNNKTRKSFPSSRVGRLRWFGDRKKFSLIRLLIRVHLIEIWFNMRAPLESLEKLKSSEQSAARVKGAWINRTRHERAMRKSGVWRVNRKFEPLKLSDLIGRGCRPPRRETSKSVCLSAKFNKKRFDVQHAALGRAERKVFFMIFLRIQQQTFLPRHAMSQRKKSHPRHRRVYVCNLIQSLWRNTL